MKSTWMKALSLLLGIGLLLGGLTACGKPKEKTDDGRIIVRFMVGGSAGELEGYEAAVEAFNAGSTDTFVEFIGLPGDGFQDKLVTQLKSKSPPDCFYSEEASFGELNNSDRLVDLTEYLNAGEYGLTWDDIPDSLVEFATHNGKVTGVPVDSNPMVLYYNVELFESLGMKSPQAYHEEGTWTFAAMQQVSEELRDAGYVGFVYENWWGPMYSMLLSSDTKVYAEDGKSANFEQPRIQQGMAYLESNMNSGAFTFAGNITSGESPDSLFIAGQAGLIYAGRWFVPDFRDITFEWDVVPFPYWETPGDSIAPVPSTPLVINSDCKYPDNAWEFMSFYCGREGQTIRLAGGGNAVPTVPGLDEIVNDGGMPAHSQYFLDARDQSFSYPREEATHPGLTDLLTAEVEKMLVGDQDAATTVANMQAHADAELAE